MYQNINKIYHAAIYVRLSKEDGDISSSAKLESNSISNQKALILDFLKDKKDIDCLLYTSYCERKKGSMRVYVNGEKLFTIDSNIDKEEFMEDIERRRIPVKSYWANQHKKNRK